MEKDEPILLSDLNLRCKENRGTTTDLVQRNVKREGSGHGPENAAFFVVMHEPAQDFRCMIDDDSDSINSSEQGVLTRLSHLSRAPLPVASTGVNLDGLRALVVDDSQINQRVAKHHLSTFGIRADVANGGQEVLDLCEM